MENKGKFSREELDDIVKYKLKQLLESIDSKNCLIQSATFTNKFKNTKQKDSEWVYPEDTKCRVMVIKYRMIT